MLQRIFSLAFALPLSAVLVFHQQPSSCSIWYWRSAIKLFRRTKRKKKKRGSTTTDTHRSKYIFLRVCFLCANFLSWSPFYFFIFFLLSLSPYFQCFFHHWYYYWPSTTIMEHFRAHHPTFLIVLSYLMLCMWIARKGKQPFHETQSHPEAMLSVSKSQTRRGAEKCEVKVSIRLLEQVQ